MTISSAVAPAARAIASTTQVAIGEKTAGSMMRVMVKKRYAPIPRLPSKFARHQQEAVIGGFGQSGHHQQRQGDTTGQGAVALAQKQACAHDQAIDEHTSDDRGHPHQQGRAEAYEPYEWATC